jgi:steroid delta-isomerase-like uncharacterized protein
MPWYHDYGDKWNAHDAAGIVAFMTPDAVYEDLALAARHVGQDEIRAFIAGMATRLSSDYTFDFAEPVAATDGGYALEWVMTGTHDGPGGRLPPTGKSFAIHGVSVGLLADGKITENRDYWSLGELLVQIGILPPIGSA